MVDAQRTIRLLQQEHHGEAGDHPAHEAGSGRTHHAHAEPVDQDGVAANVHHVHHQAGKHTDLTVALGAEQSREQEIGLSVAHYIRVNGAEDAPQDGVPPHRHDDGGDHAERDHNEHDLGGAGLGPFGLPVADVLAGDHRAAGGQRVR